MAFMRSPCGTATPGKHENIVRRRESYVFAQKTAIQAGSRPGVTLIRRFLGT